MRAVIDTNVLVSGLLSARSHPAKVVDGWLFGRYEPVVSPELVNEYRDVVLRDKFARLGSRAERLRVLEGLLDVSEVVYVEPVERICAVQAGPRDDMVLACAITGAAEFIVTGDSHLLELGNYRGVRVVTAAEFVAALEA